MTGNVFFPSAAGAPSSTRHPAPPTYSIDAFSEFSCLAVSRTPSTSALGGASVGGAAVAVMDQVFELRTTQEQDEELFRDLFAADSEWDAPVIQKLSQKKTAAIQQQQKTAPKPHIWSTGGGSPFLSVAFGPFSAQPLATAAHEAETPTLSAPVPRLNLAELMNPRPGDANVWGGALGHLPETAEEDEEGDSEDDGEDRPESNVKSRTKCVPALKLKSSSKLKTSGISSNNNKSAKLQQETLSFLEKLDLKALLHTPRPDVLDFYPTTSNGAAGATMNVSVAANQVATRSDDTRVESERDPGALLANNGSMKNKSKPKPLSKKESAVSSSTTTPSEIAARLSHMEFTYGTTKSEPRKTRKGTIDRLANPILGYTSTLQALSPDQRRKREMLAMDEEAERGWSSYVTASPVVGKLKRKEPRESQAFSPGNLSHLTSSAQIYEAAAFSSASRRVQKPAPRTREASNNQLDDERDNNSSNSVVPLKRQPLEKKSGSSRSLNARKAALKKKMEEKQRDLSKQSTSASFTYSSEPLTAASGQSTGTGATFLTQHEDEEEKLQSRVKRASQCASRPSLPPQISTAETPQQPRRPVSVRVAKPENSARATHSRRAGNRKPSEECEPEKKSASKAASSTHKPKRPQTNRQQPTAATQPRKPSNGDTGKPSDRRPFARSKTGSTSSTANGALPQVEPSVPKRKLSVGKPSASAMVLMGTASQSGNANSSASSSVNRRDIAPNSSRPAKKAQPPSMAAQTPKKAHHSNNNQNVSGSAPPKKAPATERLRRQSKEISSTTVGALSTSKTSVVLPSIRLPKGARQNGEPSARRGNAVYRRAKPRTE